MTRRPIAMLKPCEREGLRFEERAEGRFCLSCQDMQYDFRDKTEREVEAALAANGGRICGRIRLGPDGEPKFKPETPSRVGRAVRGAALALALTGCGSHDDPASDPTEEIDDDGIDHSTDTSSDPADHAGHVHRHAAVTLSGPRRGDESEGMMGHRDSPSSASRYSIVPPSSAPPATTPPATDPPAEE